MSQYITRIRTVTGDRQIDYNALANKPLKTTTISLLTGNWTGDTSPYSQAVAVSNIDINSRIDLCPTPIQLNSLQNNGTALVAANEGGTVTIYAIGSKPVEDYNMQITITNVEVDA